VNPREPIYYISVFFVETIGRRRYISNNFLFSFFQPTYWSKMEKKVEEEEEKQKGDFGSNLSK